MSNTSQKSVHSEEIREIWALFKETDKKIQEMVQQSKETDKKFQRLEKTVNDLTGKWSKFVEGLIAPGVEQLFRSRNIEVNTVYQRVRRRKDGREIEIDILAIDGEYAVLIEAKSTLGVDDVKEHIERIEKFKLLFPEYGHLKAVGAVAGIDIEKGADRFAYKSGLFVIGQTGETVTVLNDSKFKPKEW